MGLPRWETTSSLLAGETFERRRTQRLCHDGPGLRALVLACSLQGTAGDEGPSGDGVLKSADVPILMFRIPGLMWYNLPVMGKVPFEPLAQLVEHRTFNPGVAGSSPARLTSLVILKVPSSRGPGHSPFKAATRVRTPLGPPFFYPIYSDMVLKPAQKAGFTV